MALNEDLGSYSELNLRIQSSAHRLKSVFVFHLWRLSIFISVDISPYENFQRCLFTHSTLKSCAHHFVNQLIYKSPFNTTRDHEKCNAMISTTVMHVFNEVCRRGMFQRTSCWRGLA